MPWSAGTYTRFYASWTNDANNSLPISAVKFDGEDSDFAAGLNNCLTIDGLNKPTAALTWPGPMNWTRGTDGNIWSLARTGGTNNPKLQGSVTDATGITYTMSGGTLVFAGPIRGVAICQFKATTTSRTNATMSNDPDLVYAIPIAGTYAFEALLWSWNTGGAIGLQVQANYSAGFTAAPSNIAQINNVGGAGFNGTASAIQSTVAAAGTNWTIGTTQGSGWTQLKGTLVATAAGTLGVSWAQTATNATATNVGQASYLTVTQLS